MNEKFKALLVVCGFSNDEIMDILDDKKTSQYLENFAKLIVNECIKAIDDGGGSMSSIAEHITREVCQSEIRSHFGIPKPIHPPKVCEHKVDGVCQLHNLFCKYPECSKQ